MTNETKREFGVGRWIMRNGNPAVVAGIVPKPRVTHYSLVGWFWNGNEWEHERWTLGGLTLIHCTKDTDLVSPISEDLIEPIPAVEHASSHHVQTHQFREMNPTLPAKVTDLINRVAAIETAVEKVQQADDRMKNRLDDIVQGLSQSVRCLARKLSD